MIGYGSQNSVERSDAHRFVCGYGDTMRRWFLRLHNDVASGRGRRRTRCRSGHEESSSEGEHFIADEMKPDAARLGPVEVERLNRFLDVGSEFVPRVALREDAFGQVLRAIAAVGLLRHLENDFSTDTFNLVHLIVLGMRNPRSREGAGATGERFRLWSSEAFKPSLVSWLASFSGPAWRRRGEGRSMTCWEC